MRFQIFLGVASIAAAVWPTFPPTLTPREFTTVVNGTVAEDIAVIPAGWVYMVGTTTDPNYPTTPDAFDRTCGTDGACNPIPGRFGGLLPIADIVLTVVDSSGRIRYSTFLGGAQLDGIPRIAVSPDGSVWITGQTFSSAFEGFTGSCPGHFFFVARFQKTLKKLDELHCYQWEFAPMDTDVDAQGRLWVLGSTYTFNLATPNAYQRQLAGTSDLLLARFTAGQQAPQYATYLGGSWPEYASALAISPSGAIAVTGETLSNDFPVVRAFKSARLETSPVYGDAIVAVLDPSGQFLQFSTYWGGSRYEAGRGVVFDASGNLYVMGDTRSDDMPVTAGAVRPRCQAEGGFTCSDAFIAKFSSTGSLVASTFFGGIGTDYSRGVQATSDGRVIVVGGTQSRDFPVVNASPSPRPPFVNAEQTYVSVLDDSLTRLMQSGFAGNQQFLPNGGLLALRDRFEFVAAQVTPASGLRSGIIGTYVRAMRLP